MYYNSGSGGGSGAGSGGRRQQQGQQQDDDEEIESTEDAVRKLANNISSTGSFSSSGADTTITNPAVVSVFGSFLSTLFTTSTSPFLAAQADIIQLQFLGFTNGAVSPGGFGSNSVGIDSTSITPTGTNGQPASAAALVGPQAAVPTRPDGRFIVASLGIGLTVIAVIALVVVVKRMRKRGQQRRELRQQRSEENDLDLYDETEQDKRHDEPLEEEEDDGSITVLSDLKQLEWQMEQEGRPSEVFPAVDHHHHDDDDNKNNSNEEYPHDEEQLEREESSASSSSSRGKHHRLGFWKMV